MIRLFLSDFVVTTRPCNPDRSGLTRVNITLSDEIWLTMMPISITAAGDLRCFDTIVYFVFDDDGRSKRSSARPVRRSIVDRRNAATNPDLEHEQADR